MTSGLTAAEFDQLFQRFVDSRTSTSVFRWEARQQYAIASDEPSLVAYRDGTARPERSVRTSGWLARIAKSTMLGKTWTRVRYVEEPLSEYVRWELLAYVESQAAGERVLLDRRSDQTDVVDYWVFDGADPADRYAVLMHYDGHGVPVEFEYRDDTSAWLSTSLGLIEHAIPLNAYLALHRGATGVG